MSRYTAHHQCAVQGCTETTIYAIDTRKEQREHYARYRKNPWICLRHTKPNEVLAADNKAIDHVLVSYETDFGYGQRVHQFWATPENAAEEKGGNGVCFGPGFKAWAKDFPAGTRLIVTARVELPAALPSRETRLASETDQPKET